MKVMKASPYIITDDSFSLSTFMEKIDPVIEADKEWVSLAKTGFMLIAKDAFTSLLSTVTSQDSALTERTEQMEGLADDELCAALSKLSSGGVKVVQTSLKQLIDIKPLAGADKSAFDLVEAKILEIIAENTKGEEFDKKKKEI